MNSQLSITAADPGEASILLKNQAEHKNQEFSVAFPQFASIPVQKVLRQEVRGKDLALIIDADRLADILEAGSPCQIKIPQLDLTQTIIWPVIVGRRSQNRNVINVKSDSVAVTAPKDEATEKVGFVVDKKEPFIKPLEDPNNKSEAAETLDHSKVQDNLVDPLTNPSQSSDESVNSNINELSSTSEEEEIAPQKKKIPSFLIFMGIVILVVLLGGGIAYLQRSHHDVEKPPQTIEKKKDPEKKIKKPVQPVKEPAKKSDTVPTPQNHALNLSTLSVNDVLNKAPNIASITKEGERRLSNKQADDGILLLENAAFKGDSEAMLKLALLYSPVNFKTNGPIPSPDMREAARYFQKAVDNGSKEAIEPRQALHDWLSQKAASGDEMARLTLKDFWQ